VAAPALGQLTSAVGVPDSDLWPACWMPRAWP
jgi:hypothetical protein